jgi:hypothetical protein
MSDDKPKPVDDLKEGLGLLFRAAKGAVERLPTGKFEDVAKDAVREVGRAFESLGTELENFVGKATAAPETPPAPDATEPPGSAAPNATAATTDSSPSADSASEPKGPRIG